MIEWVLDGNSLRVRYENKIRVSEIPLEIQMNHDLYYVQGGHLDVRSEIGHDEPSDLEIVVEYVRVKL